MLCQVCAAHVREFLAVFAGIDLAMLTAMIRVVVGLLGSVLVLVGCSGKAEDDSPAPATGGSAGQSSGGSGGTSAGAAGVGASAGTAGTGGAACVDGQHMTAGCNGCVCNQGQWQCTSLACNVCGGFAGNTCSADQYCAYTEGSLCGAADASAACATRPTACDDIYAPVCGCDRKTYPSTCDAAMHGQGVYTNGACDNSTSE